MITLLESTSLFMIVGGWVLALSVSGRLMAIPSKGGNPWSGLMWWFSLLCAKHSGDMTHYTIYYIVPHQASVIKSGPDRTDRFGQKIVKSDHGPVLVSSFLDCAGNLEKTKREYIFSNKPLAQIQTSRPSHIRYITS